MRVPGVPFIQGKNSNGSSTKYAIAIHNTSNPGANADAEASYATRRTDGVGSHFYADAVKVIQSNDTDRKVGHAGSSNGNTYAIAVEITGANSWSRRQWLNQVDWAELGAVLARVCRAHGIPVVRCTVAQMKANPKVRGFYSHDDMRRAWGGTTHDDPGPNFPWDRLLGAVNAALTPSAAGGDDMALTTDERRVLDNVERMLTQLAKGETLTGKGQAGETVPYENKLYAAADRPQVSVDAEALAVLLAPLIAAELAGVAPATQKQIAKDGAIAAAKVIADAIAQIS